MFWCADIGKGFFYSKLEFLFKWMCLEQKNDEYCANKIYYSSIIAVLHSVASSMHMYHVQTHQKSESSGESYPVPTGSWLFWFQCVIIMLVLPLLCLTLINSFWRFNLTRFKFHLEDGRLQNLLVCHTTYRWSQRCSKFQCFFIKQKVLLTRNNNNNIMHTMLSYLPQISANHFFTSFAVCFRLLLCLNVHCCFLRIFMYCSFFIMLFTVIRFPSPLAVKHSQSIRFLPPCLTVGMVFLWLKASPFLHHIKDTSLWPNNYIFVSSCHKTDELLQRPNRLLCALSGEQVS